MAINEKSIEQYLKEGQSSGPKTTWGREALATVADTISAVANYFNAGQYVDSLFRSGRVNPNDLVAFINNIASKVNAKSTNELSKFDSMLNTIASAFGSSPLVQAAVTRQRTKVEGLRRGAVKRSQRAEALISSATNAANRYATRSGGEVLAGKGDEDVAQAVKAAREAQNISEKGNYEQKLQN